MGEKIGRWIFLVSYFRRIFRDFKSVLITTSRYVDEMDKASRTQEKVLAKMEGLRKKQSCSPEELNKLRKMVDKQHRVITAEQRQQRRNDRKAGNQKAGKSKKFNIDNKVSQAPSRELHQFKNVCTETETGKSMI